MITFNLGTFITQNAQRLGDEMAVVADGESVTWREVNSRIDRLANAMQHAGIQLGDRVLVQAKNSLRAFEIKWGCFKLGATWVPVNFRLTPTEVAQIASDCQPTAIFYDFEFEKHASAAAQACAIQRSPLLVCIGEEAQRASYSQFVGSISAHFEDALVDRDQPAWIFYTSGTTGRSKGAVLTHGQLAFVVTSHLADMFPGATERDSSLVLAPLSHGAGVHALAHVAKGAPQIIFGREKFKPAAVWELVQRFRVTNFFAVPTMIKTLVEDASVSAFDLSSLKHVNYGGAPMFRADQKLALDKLGPVLVQHYGLGEFTANISVLSPADHLMLDDPSAKGPKVGSCGAPRTCVEVGIFDGEGKRLRPNSSGEICAKGQAAFAGYYNDKEATGKAFRDGWFRTGDLGYLDEHGYLYINGRVSDMYISGGLNVYPREIEEMLLDDVRISEVAIVGLPHAKWGEIGVAVLVCRDGQALSETEVLAVLDGRLARYKFPKQIHFWPELPKSAYGKILKREIVATLMSRQSAEAEQEH